jgi:hypothetical protein
LMQVDPGEGAAGGADQFVGTKQRLSAMIQVPVKSCNPARSSPVLARLLPALAKPLAEVDRRR